MITVDARVLKVKNVGNRSKIGRTDCRRAKVTWSKFAHDMDQTANPKDTHKPTVDAYLDGQLRKLPFDRENLQQLN